MQVSRPVRLFGMVASVSVLVPLCLTGCSSASSFEAHAAELRAAAGSDLLDVPRVLVYSVETAQLTSPKSSPVAALAEALAVNAIPSGTLVLHDGILTEGDFRLSVPGFPEASFTLTEPTVLRKPNGVESPVTAVGVLTVNGVARPDTSLLLSPTTLDDQTAAFDVTFSVPDNPVVAGQTIPLDDLTAHVVFSAGPHDDDVTAE